MAGKKKKKIKVKLYKSKQEKLKKLRGASREALGPFHRPTKVMKSKKVYDRKRAKRQLKKEAGQ